MKKLLILVLLCVPAVAQITLNGSDMPASGSSYRLSRIMPQNIPDLDTTQLGASQTWDFRYMEADSQEVLTFKQGFQTPYLLYYTTKIGVPTNALDWLSLAISFTGVEITNVWEFYGKTSTQWRAEGRGMQIDGLPVPAYNEDNDEIYYFPIAYGNQNTSTFRYETGAGTIGYSSSGTRTTTVDGWGTLRLPMGDFTVLRLKSVVQAKDTLQLPPVFGFSPPPIALPYTRIEYKWLADGKGLPMLQINVTNPPMGIPAIVEAIYQDSPLKPIASFSVLNEEGCAPLNVQFVNESKVYKTVSWDFGDGETSTEAFPTHSYTTPGTYSVRLTATNPNGSDDTLMTNLVTVAGTTPTFTVQNTQIQLPTPIGSFNNTTAETQQGTYAYRWDFGDGSTSQQKHASHLYTTTGCYTVKLRVTDPSGCTVTDSIVNAVCVNPTGRAQARANSYSLYPLPVQDELLLSTPVYSLAVYDLQGRQLAVPYVQQGGTTRIDTAALPEGLFVLIFETDRGWFCEKIQK